MYISHKLSATGFFGRTGGVRKKCIALRAWRSIQCRHYVFGYGAPMVQLARRWETADRFYEVLWVDKDLFDRHVLVRRWGGRFTRRGGAQVCAVGQAECLALARQTVLERARRGYAERPFIAYRRGLRAPRGRALPRVAPL